MRGAVVVAIARDLLGLRQQRLDPAEVEQRVARVGLLDDAGDDVALAAGVLLVLHLALGLADALQDDLLGGLRGDAPEVGGRVVPLAGDVAVLVELLRDHADLAGLDVDLDERLLGRVGHALVRGDERVRERLEHDLVGDALLDRERRQRFEHLGIFHASPLRSQRARGALDAWPGTRLRAPLEHGARLRDVGVRDLLVDAVVGLRRRSARARRSTSMPRTRFGPALGVELDRDLVADGAGVVRRRAERALDARAAHLEQERSRRRAAASSRIGETAWVTAVIASRSTPPGAVDRDAAACARLPPPISSTS